MTEFGGWSLTKAAFKAVQTQGPKSLLEFGSGKLTAEYKKFCPKVACIEHNSKWVNYHAGVRYYHAPLQKDGWYDPSIVGDAIGWERPDVVIIDGPIGARARSKLIDHIWFVDNDTLYLVDDVSRQGDFRAAMAIIEHTKYKDYAFFGDGKKAFCLIGPWATEVLAQTHYLVEKYTGKPRWLSLS